MVKIRPVFGVEDPNPSSSILPVAYEEISREGQKKKAIATKYIKKYLQMTIQVYSDKFR